MSLKKILMTVKNALNMKTASRLGEINENIKNSNR